MMHEIGVHQTLKKRKKEKKILTRNVHLATIQFFTIQIYTNDCCTVFHLHLICVWFLLKPHSGAKPLGKKMLTGKTFLVSLQFLQATLTGRTFVQSVTNKRFVVAFKFTQTFPYICSNLLRQFDQTGEI